jgi:hypothetical protein
VSISATTGSAANNSGSVTSLALPSITTTTGRDVVVAIALGSTGSSVSSISNSAGSYASWTLRKAKNGSGVRVEIWTAHVSTGAATVFTVNISGATSVSAQVEEYSGVSGFNNTSSTSGNSQNLGDSLTTTQQSNYVVAAIGFSCQSGDTLTAITGTSRQSSIPAATATGGALYDNTAAISSTVQIVSRISSTRQWAIATLELLSGGVSSTVVPYATTTAADIGNDAVLHTSGQPSYTADFLLLKVQAPDSSALPPSSYVPVPYAQQLKGGTTGVAYSETISAQGGTSPYTFARTSGSLPTGLSLNTSTGVISGTPSVAGTYSFTIQATDHGGFTGSTSFQIAIAAPSAGGGSYTFLN